MGNGFARKRCGQCGNLRLDTWRAVRSCRFGSKVLVNILLFYTLAPRRHNVKRNPAQLNPIFDASSRIPWNRTEER